MTEEYCDCGDNPNGPLRKAADCPRHGTKKRTIRRAIKVNGTDLVLELSKATAVKTDKNMIYLDQLKDGTWRLIFNANLIPDFTKVVSFEIIRED